jgi:L,D-peptidoglycan transpeptidase YkuD (ErfK/YbiS/YcfS/YnhG family)
MVKRKYLRYYYSIDYNLNPVIKNKGSAIFLHIAKKKYQPTKGCVAIIKKILNY